MKKGKNALQNHGATCHWPLVRHMKGTQYWLCGGVPFKSRTHKILIKTISPVMVLPKSMAGGLSHSPKYMLSIFYMKA